MGCLARLLILVLLAAAVFFAWLSRDRWWPGAREERAVVPTWERLTPEGAQRARVALQRLQRPDGPVFASVSGGDIASYVLLDANRAASAFTDSAEAAVIGDQLVIRAPVPLRELGAGRDLGPLAGMLREREPVQVSGRLRVAAPGRGELTITEVRVRDFPLPTGIVARMLGANGGATGGRTDATVPVTLPRHIGDVRVGDGRITLYKNNP